MFTTKWTALALDPGRYVVRPEGQLGTCGWSPFPWTAIFVDAMSENEALFKAHLRTVQQEAACSYVP